MSNVSAPTALETRLAWLEARAAIENLMQRYVDAADRKYTARRQKRDDAVIAAAAHEQAACFTEDAEWDGGGFGGTLKGRAEIEAFFRRSPWLFTAHHYGNPLFEITDGEARVRWKLLEVGVREADGQVQLLTGTVRQRCRQTVEGWRIMAMVFETLHAVSLADVPEALCCLIPAGERL